MQVFHKSSRCKFAVCTACGGEILEGTVFMKTKGRNTIHYFCGHCLRKRVLVYQLTHMSHPAAFPGKTR